MTIACAPPSGAVAPRDPVAERGELGRDRLAVAGLELQLARVGEAPRRVDRRLRVHAEVERGCVRSRTWPVGW